jgi:hypothetical protein
LEKITLNELDALLTLKEEADKLGIKYHTNIGFDKLKEKVDNMNQTVTEEAKPIKKTKGQIKAEQIKAAKRLHHIRVTCMSDTRKGWKGDWFTVMNSTFGTIKKYVPFNLITHVESCILKQLKRKKKQEFYEVPGKFGTTDKRARMVPMFAIEELDDLSVEELKELATQQAVNRSITKE